MSLPGAISHHKIISMTSLKIGFVLFIGMMKAKLNTLSIISQSCKNVKLVENRLLKWINGMPERVAETDLVRGAKAVDSSPSSV